jgi:hypothetical protein
MGQSSPSEWQSETFASSASLFEVSALPICDWPTRLWYRMKAQRQSFFYRNHGAAMQGIHPRRDIAGSPCSGEDSATEALV